MTNKYILATVMLLAAGYVSAQNKLSPTAITLLEEYKEAPASRGEAPEVCAIVSLNSPDDLAEFETLGLEIEDDKDGILLVHIPMDRVEEVAAMKCVKSISFGQLARPMMDKARVTSRVDALHAGEGLSKAYTGKGVITGLYDTGIDPTHVNFIDANEESRVLYAMMVSGGRATPMVETDDRTQTHGTHVLGIMAGGYKGEAKWAGKTDANPYYGVATESDIIATGGTLKEENILAGVKYIVDQAKALGQPAVVNLSIGWTYGPHDGTTDFSRKLDTYGEDAIIVLAAGNDGTTKMGVGKDFTASDNKLTTSIWPIDRSTDKRASKVSNYSGSICFYASDNTPFKLRIFVYDKNNGETLSEYVLDKSTGGRKAYVGNRPKNTMHAFTPLQDFDLACGDNAYLQVSSNVYPNSNCYGVEITHTNFDLEGLFNNFVLGIEIEGHDGQAVRGYANATGPVSSGELAYASEFYDFSIDGWSTGSSNGTINDMACGKNVIAIGSYNSRNTFPTISSTRGPNFGSAYTPGDISSFSSFGTLSDGRNLPEICAPGAFIVSSYSRFYIASRNISDSSNDLCAKTTGSDYFDHYWGRMQGTSMAAPYAAGVFALWLEANPNLDVNAIRDIAQKTAIKDSYTSRGDAVKWGAGKLDAYEGLKMALSYQSSVDDVLAEKAIIYNEVAKGVYDIFAQGASTVSASLYALNGTQAAAATAVGENVTLNAHGLTAGVYILRINADGNTETHKVVVK